MFCPKCFSETQTETLAGNGLDNKSVCTQLRCIECGLKFLVLGKNQPWPSENGTVTQQRNTALIALRRLGVTVNEISEVIGLSENYVGQITKAPIL